MLVRMTRMLKEHYSNLGLPEGVLTSVAGMAVIGLGEDCTDEVLEARAKESSIFEMLKSFQSHADKIRTDAAKARKQVENKVEENKEIEDAPSWFSAYVDKQNETQQKLLDRIAELEGANKAKSFASMVDGICAELNLSGAMLDHARHGLSSNMDETTVRNKLGAFKKMLVDSGVHFEEKVSAQERSSRDQQYIDDARKWVEEHKVKDTE